MENPLTPEQVEEINKISKLPLEEQKKVLPDFLKTLSKEQIEFLKQQQGGQCVFCGIAEGKIPAKKIYEDGVLIAALDINPANKGHVILFPKKHYEILNQIPDVGHLFNVAKKLSALIFEVTKAEGTNILVATGAAAGQVLPHVSVHIIPRFKDDGVQFAWEKKEVSEKEMDSLQKELSEKIQKIGVEADYVAPVEEKVEKETKRRGRAPKMRDRIP